MRKVGETVAGMVLVEMPIEEWSTISREKEPIIEHHEHSLEWHIHRAMNDGRLSIRTGNALLRGIHGNRFNGEYYPGFLEGKTLDEFLVFIQDESMLSVPSIGKKSIKEIRRAFLGSKIAR